MTWLTSIPFAHRGLHDADRPENSLAAFEAAAAAGYGIELDVHATADGEAVVVHDADLARLTGRPGNVRDLDAAALRARDLLGTGARIPRLGEVFDLVAGRVPVMIEIKHQPGRAGDLEARVRALVAGYHGPVAVASFDPRTVAWFARHDPGVLRGQAASGDDHDRVPAPLRWLLQRLAFNRWARPHFVSYALDGLPNPWCDAWRRRGRPLLAWTARTPADLARAGETADNVIFEDVRPAPVRLSG